MSLYTKIIENLPEVEKPTQKRLSFGEKFKWTLITLLIFFGLGAISLYGLGPNALARFNYLSIILGAEFGSIISLGIGPIVTASIVLQLLNGAGVLKFDLTTPEGKKSFQGTQKILALFFILFEALIYVFMGGLSPLPGVSPWVLIIQLIIGGILIMLMDEVISKWGFGSGISLFIAANVSKELVIRLISPLNTQGAFAFLAGDAPVGAILSIFYSLQIADFTGLLISLFAIIATVVVFIFAVYAQAMKVEVPLALGTVRGHGVRWPLSFIYTSNIPVILVAALLANIQLWASLLQRWGHPILGTFNGSTPTSGLVAWIHPPNIASSIIQGTLAPIDLAHALVYMIIMIVGAVVFSLFWVQTAGMDGKSQAKQIMASGLSIPGFRKDERVIESILNRYIMPLTVMGAITVGFLASLADLSGALTSGTGLLLTVMIIYKLYEEIAQQHLMDMNPTLRKFMEK